MTTETQLRNFERNVRDELAEERASEYPLLVMQEVLSWMESCGEPWRVAGQYDEIVAKPVDDCSLMELLQRALWSPEGRELFDRMKELDFARYSGILEIVGDDMSDYEVRNAMEEAQRNDDELDEYEAAHAAGRI